LADVKTEADVASRLGVIYMSTMFVGVICLQVKTWGHLHLHM